MTIQLICWIPMLFTVLSTASSLILKRFPSVSIQLSRWKQCLQYWGIGVCRHATLKVALLAYLHNYQDQNHITQCKSLNKTHWKNLRYFSIRTYRGDHRTKQHQWAVTGSFCHKYKRFWFNLLRAIRQSLSNDAKHNNFVEDSGEKAGKIK